MKRAYPLDWPTMYGRTPANQRIKSKFIQGMEKSQRFFADEMRRLAADNVIASANIPVRQDGGFYTDWLSRKIEDPGVAVYFTYKGKETCLACDQYVSVWENLYAIGKAVEAIRGLERWGITEVIDRAFAGFQQLPAPAAVKKSCWEILELSEKPESVEDVKAAYRKRAAIVHPDKGGTAAEFSELSEAYNEALLKFI